MGPLAFLVCIVLAMVPEADLVNVTVDTPVGTFVGFKINVTFDGATVSMSKFLGIPYAEPPVGERRFQKPMPKDVLTEPLVVQTQGAECLQMRQLIGEDEGIPWSEDCLFLNIYAPDTTDNGTPLAVMVWIHGGGYVVGSSKTYVADLLAARGNVIVVTINYRLSVLGFLNLGGNRPSNFGLWDQHMAIKWVHNNIAQFGGDDQRITIFGESAGAGSVIHQGIYPGNKGLFQRIIAESGDAAAPWSDALHPLAEAREFATILNCPDMSADSILDCLKGVSAQDIYDALNDVSNGLVRNPMPFVPSVDNDFVKMHPKEILNVKYNVAATERDTFSSFDLLIGCNSDEGASNIGPMFGVYGDPESFLPNRTYFEKVLIPLLISEYRDNIPGDLNTLSNLMAATYSTWEDPENPVHIRQNFVNIHSDFFFLVSSMLTTELYAQRAPNGAFVYQFIAKPSQHVLPTPTWIQGANHADELPYVFGLNPFSESGLIGDFQQWEKELSSNIMIMWTNFVKSGNPNQPRDIGINWQPYTQASKRYLEIGRTLDSMVLKENFILDRINLWDQLIPTVNEAVERASESCDVSGSPHLATHVTITHAYLFALLVVIVFYK